jgi:hypothetical protein
MNRRADKTDSSANNQVRNPCIEVVMLEGEITPEMRAAYDRFWQLVIGRVLNKCELKPQRRRKVKTKTKKRKGPAQSNDAECDNR